MGAAATVPVVAKAQVLGPVIASGIAFDTILCPACGAQQRWPTSREFPNHEAWVDFVTTPHQIHCGMDGCQIPMLVQFGRKVVNGRRV